MLFFKHRLLCASTSCEPANRRDASDLKHRPLLLWAVDISRAWGHKLLSWDCPRRMPTFAWFSVYIDFNCVYLPVADLRLVDRALTFYIR